MSTPPGWAGAGLPLPAAREEDPCTWCGGTGKDYRGCWDLWDATYPEDCEHCDGTGHEPDEEEA